MTDNDDAVTRVFVVHCDEEFYDGLTDASPGFPEAVVDVAAIAEFRDVDFVYFEIFGPVLLGTSAAEGKDDQFALAGDGDET